MTGTHATGQNVVANRRMQALELSLSGLSMAKIAKELGCSKTLVHKDLSVAMEELTAKHDAEALAMRSKQTARYERLLASCWNKAIGGNLAALEKAVSICSRIDSIHGLSSEKSLSVLINQQINNELTIEPITPQQLEEYADVIRRLAALGDRTPEDLEKVSPLDCREVAHFGQNVQHVLWEYRNSRNLSFPGL